MVHEALQVRDSAARQPRAAAVHRPGGQPPRLSLRDRYSQFVGFMKLLLPALAAALVLLVVVWPQISLDEDRFRLSMSRLTPDQAESLTMLNARFQGTDERDRPYTITADMATQDSRNPELVKLELPKADMTLEDGTWLALTARRGEYHRASQLLDLVGAVSLFHDNGFELRTERARIDLANGSATGGQKVIGQGTEGSITGEGFQVLDRGARIIFTGESRLVLRPQAEAAIR